MLRALLRAVDDLSGHAAAKVSLTWPEDAERAVLSSASDFRVHTR
jgi:hypothetical protein